MLEEAVEEAVVRLELLVVIVRLRTVLHPEFFSPHTGEPRVTLAMSMEPAVEEAAVEVLVL